MKTFVVILYCAIFFAPIVALCLLAVFGYHLSFGQALGAATLVLLGIIVGAVLADPETER